MTNPVLPTLTITLPRAGESFAVGQTARIQWQAAHVERVWIGYSECDTCLTWLAADVPNTGSYDWLVKVDKPRGTQFKIRIVGYQTGVAAVTAESAGSFTVQQPIVLSTLTPTALPTRPPTATATASPTPAGATATPTIPAGATATLTPLVGATVTPTIPAGATVTPTIPAGATATPTPPAGATATPVPTTTPMPTTTPAPSDVAATPAPAQQEHKIHLPIVTR